MQIRSFRTEKTRKPRGGDEVVGGKGGGGRGKRKGGGGEGKRKGAGAGWGGGTNSCF